MHVSLRHDTTGRYLTVGVLRAWRPHRLASLEHGCKTILPVPLQAPSDQTCLRKPWPTRGHAGTISTLKGGVQARLDAEHKRRLASIKTHGSPFLHRRLEAERAADERDATFQYLHEEGEKTSLTMLAWNAGKLQRTGQKTYSNLRSNTYVADFVLRDHSHIKLLQEASGLDQIAGSRCHLISEATGCAILAHGV